MKKVAGYVTGSNAKEQRRAIEAYCLENEMAVVEWLKGAEMAFGEVAYGNWMRNRKIDAVVVADSGIVSGNVYEFYAYKCVLREKHSDLVAVESGFTGHQLYTKIFDEFIDTMCRLNTENVLYRDSESRIGKKAKGAYIGGQAPMGYKVEDGKLVINEAEVPVVLCIMDRKHAGKTMISTVDALNQGGYKTRRGKPFVISTVQSIWNNEMFYRGYNRYGKDEEWVRGEHEPILKD